MAENSPNQTLTGSDPKPVGSNNATSQSSDTKGGGWIVAAILAAILWFTNPSPVSHNKALGMDGFTGVVVGVAAAISGGEIKYNNYFLFSTTSFKSPQGKSKTATLGILGFVKVLIG